MTAIAFAACSAAEAQPSARADAPAKPAQHGDAVGEPVAYPAGWKPLPAIATAVRTAATADGTAIDAIDAWGDPVAGCYSVSLALRGGAAPAPAVADQILQSIQKANRAPGTAGSADRSDAPSASSTKRAAAGARSGAAAYALTVDDVVRPTQPDGVLAFQFAAAPYHGRVRARLGAGRIAATACFANQRSPHRCEAACTDILVQVRDTAPVIEPAAKGATR